MKAGRPAGSRRAAPARALEALVDELLNNSLVLYLVAFAAHRTWVLLNSDVLQLVRRLH
ncbi:MAG TPA: hypothetical protein VLA38_10385 [Steroidobacteraceae bacterium]|jgi:hypothetical protein|nr:hypothetical protein [Steroidobacteraceae bacterium]